MTHDIWKNRPTVSRKQTRNVSDAIAAFHFSPWHDRRHVTDIAWQTSYVGKLVDSALRNGEKEEEERKNALALQIQNIYMLANVTKKRSMEWMRI